VVPLQAAKRKAQQLEHLEVQLWMLHSQQPQKNARVATPVRVRAEDFS
jgi:hypothetical protein